MTNNETVIICACLDVTKEEIVEAIKSGCKDIQTMKRYTGCTTGLCQGKFCALSIVLLISEELGVDPSLVGLPTTRQPHSRVPLGAFASMDERGP